MPSSAAGTSFATGLIANDSEQTQFAFTQERAALVQVTTTADAYREAAVRLPVAADEPAFVAVQAAATAAFLRLTQAYNEAFLVLEDTSALDALYSAAATVEGLDLEPFPRFGGPAQDRAVDVLDARLGEFLVAARGQVRERLSSVD